MGLSALFAHLLSLGWYFAALPAALLFLTAGEGQRLFFLLVSAASFAHTSLRVDHPLLREEVEGTAYFSIESIRHPRSSFGKSKLVYRGTVETFYRGGERIGRHLPCSLAVEENSLRPPGKSAYWIEGKLLQTSKNSYILKPSGAPWKPVQGSWSLAELRFQAKKRLKSYLERELRSETSRSFLSGLATGEFSDPLLYRELGRFSLQHIMAISGFHFTILAALSHLFLFGFLPPQRASLLLLFLLSLYTLFIGPSPSIVRAFLAVGIYLIGLLIGRASRPLNSLGIALLLLLLYDPNLALSCGFALSFQIAAAILFFYPPIDRGLERFFPKLAWSEARSLPFLDKHLYLASSWIRPALALGASVHLVSLPLSLFFWGSFPLLSLFYNLFFPPLVSICLFLLLTGLAFSWLPPAAHLIHRLNDVYSDTLLKLVSRLPSHLDVQLYAELPESLIVLYLTALFGLGILLHKKGSPSYL